MSCFGPLVLWFRICVYGPPKLLHSSTTEQEFKMGLVRIMKNVINVVSLNKAAFKVVLLKDKDKLT